MEFRLVESKEGTQLSVTESGFDKIPATRRNEAFRMQEEGWTERVKSISAHVA